MIAVHVGCRGGSGERDHDGILRARFGSACVPAITPKIMPNTTKQMLATEPSRTPVRGVTTDELAGPGRRRPHLALVLARALEEGPRGRSANRLSEQRARSTPAKDSR